METWSKVLNPGLPDSRTLLFVPLREAGPSVLSGRCKRRLLIPQEDALPGNEVLSLRDRDSPFGEGVAQHGAHKQLLRPMGRQELL